MGDMPSKGPVGKTMKANSEKFVACARDAVSVQTGSPQNIQLDFTIDPLGRVQRAEISKMSSPDPDLYDCIRRTLRKIQFPVPNDGKSKKITYPLVLKPES